MTLFYATDFADRLENEIIPALRAGFVVLTDRYIFSLMARAIARGEDRPWIERVASFALVPHAIYYLRAEVRDLVPRVVLGRGAFDHWESGMDMRFGEDMHDSFVKYQTRVIHALDRMAKRYNFVIIDATKTPDQIFRELQRSIGKLFKVRADGQAIDQNRQAQWTSAPYTCGHAPRRSLPARTLLAPPASGSTTAAQAE